MKSRQDITVCHGPGIFACALLGIFIWSLPGCVESPAGSLNRGLTLKEALEDARTCSSGFDYPQALIDGLSHQLIEELRCMDPSWLEFYEPCQNVGCISADGPQPLAARPEVLDALRAAATAENDFISIRAGYRDVAMQYYSRWYKEHCDSSFPAAVPGQSNHQGGRAVDIAFYNYWWDPLLDAGFEHPIPGDEPHFELVGDAEFRAESEELKSLSIEAFQRIWNRAHPNDQIAEDGVYGPQTKERLGNSPVAGFNISMCGDEPNTGDATDGDALDVDGDALDVDGDVLDVDGDDVDGDTSEVHDSNDLDGGDSGDVEDVSDDVDGSETGDAAEDAGGDITGEEDASDSRGEHDGLSQEFVDSLRVTGGGCMTTGGSQSTSLWFLLLLLGCSRGRYVAFLSLRNGHRETDNKN